MVKPLARDEINQRNRANARRKVLEELGFRDIENASDELLDTMRPSGIRAAFDEMVRNNKVFKHGPIQELLDTGVRLPNSVEYMITLEEEQKKRMKKQQEREDELRRMYNNLPKIYRDQLADEGYETPQEVGDRVRDIRRELEVVLKEGIDAHHDVVKKSGAAYRWGPGENNPVQERMEKTLSELNDTQLIWLLSMHENGTWFSDAIDYDSTGDGRHTRYLYSARNILESAKDVGSDGIHPQYGSLSLRSMKNVFKSMADSEFEEPTTFGTPEEEKAFKDVLKSDYIKRGLDKDDDE